MDYNMDRGFKLVGIVIVAIYPFTAYNSPPHIPIIFIFLYFSLHFILFLLHCIDKSYIHVVVKIVWVRTARHGCNNAMMASE